jgi:hypothetical protein
MMRSNVGRTHNEAWRRNRPLALEISWIFLTVFRFTYRIHTVRAPSVRVTVLRETVTQSDCYSDRLLASPTTITHNDVTPPSKPGDGSQPCRQRRSIVTHRGDD